MLGIGDDLQPEKVDEENKEATPAEGQGSEALGGAEADDSDDDEPIIRRKSTKKKFNRSLLEDSDEEEASTAAVSADNAASDKEESGDEESESDKENTPVGPQKSRIRVMSDDDDDDSNAERIPLTAITKPSLFSSDIFDAEMDDSNSAVSQKTDDSNDVQEKSEAMATQEDSDSDEEAGTSQDGGDSSSSDDGSSSDEDDQDDAFKKLDERFGDDDGDGDDEDEGSAPAISEELRRKLAKGAAKKNKPASSQSSRPKTSDVEQIHSETQRIVRESAVSLPYHQPQRLGLSVFLARSQQKQAQLQKVLKAQPNCTWKTAPDLASQPSLKEFIPKTADVTPDSDVTDKKPDEPAAEVKTDGPATEAMDIDETTPPSNNEVAAVSQNILDREMESSNQDIPNKEVESGSQDLPNREAEPKSQEVQEINEDDFPDLIIELDDPSTVQSDSADANNVQCEAGISDASDKAQVALAEKPGEEVTADDNCDTLPDIGSEKKPGDSNSCEINDTEDLPDLATRLKHKDALTLTSKKTEQDSGFLTGPCSEEENSGDMPSTADAETVTTAPKATTTPDRKLKAKTLLTPKLAGLGLDAIAPKLSGAPHDFIDLDLDVEVKQTSAKNVGVHSLMERMVKHSTRQRRKAKDVELSVVHKDKIGDTDKEELRLEKVVVHIDEEEMMNPELEKPGAKLSLLKKRLTTQMQKRRADIREQQKGIFEMDNEEGFLDEDGELTDQTDTDVEEEEEGYDEEDEDEDFDVEEELRREEKKKKKKSEFVDEEALDEDDEEDDEDGEEVDEDDVEAEDEEMDEDEMNLQLDLGEEDSNDTASIATTQSPRKADSVKVAPRLQKAQTLELFDDDAMSESPVSTQEVSVQDKSSQNTNLDRPFERLSQNKGTDDNDGFMGIASDVPQDNEAEAASLPEVDRELSLQSADTSYSDLIPAGQPTTSKSRTSFSEGRGTPDLYTPSSKGSVAMNGAKSRSRGNDLHLLIEDSQDLLSGQFTPALERQGSSSSYFDDESHSLMLDADGFVREKSGEKRSVRKQLKLDITTNSMQSGVSDTQDELMGLCSGNFSTGNKADPAHKALFGGASPAVSDSAPMDELFGLCSGRFTQKDAQDELPLSLCSGRFTQKADQKVAPPMKATQMQATQGGGMDELMGLCSGKFTGNSPMKKKKKGIKRKPSVDEDDGGDDEDEVKSTGSFIVDDADMEDEGDEHAFSSEEEGGQDAEDDEEDEEVQLAKQMFKGFKAKKGKIRRDFVDEEAQLSGSEGGSDEDDDLDEEYDFLEKEAGDEEDLPSDEELRNQVNRVHMKSLIDEDKRELRLMQEMYLADGDLHSEGTGRIRRFRWRNIDDDDTQQDMFKNSDDEEAEDEETEQESKWRKERFEREKFLQEQKENKEEPEQTGSQLLKLGKVIFKPKLKRGASHPPVIPKSKGTEKPSSQPASKNIFKVPNRHGSFLKRDKETLAKIAELNKPSSNLGGARSGGNFVFTAHNKEEGDSEPNAGAKKRTAHVPKPQPVRRSASVPASQPAKKPRLEKSSTLPQNSIFNLF